MLFIVVGIFFVRADLTSSRNFSRFYVEDLARVELEAVVLASPVLNGDVGPNGEPG